MVCTGDVELLDSKVRMPNSSVRFSATAPGESKSTCPALLRGAPAERWAAWAIAVDAGILDAEESTGRRGIQSAEGDSMSNDEREEQLRQKIRQTPHGTMALSEHLFDIMPTASADPELSSTRAGRAFVRHLSMAPGTAWYDDPD